ncbi:MAG: ethylbenzene dehydrogenase-related protein [Pseudomonadota bacterium]|nr:ethylbenzene dehydrogenase-related protein [Pseudomonadota bacterium]
MHFLYCLLGLTLSLSVLAQQNTITVKHIQTPLPTTPLAADWQPVPRYEVQMMPQQIAQPILDQASIDTLSVQGLTDGHLISWRVSWVDKTQDIQVDTGRFADAVALEFPLTSGAAPMMGHKGNTVQILYWKGLWQQDNDQGFQDVQDLYPNYWADLYWFAKGSFPYRVPEDFQAPEAKQWFIAYQAGNPMAQWHREQPVEELVAEGWGSLTTQSQSVTSGQGVWQEGRWTVMFSRPLTTEDKNDHQFKLGQKSQIAFAVWQGAADNVGGRKHWSNWITYAIEP